MKNSFIRDFETYAPHSYIEVVVKRERKERNKVFTINRTTCVENKRGKNVASESILDLRCNSLVQLVRKCDGGG